ncbi:MAG: hypothetical protein COZ70_12390 [Deltaproteobacteria bacterium CG_4_8_14_3_um_filter_51_11]|nr:hypothetical protein [bacterium]OIP40401.1 MAG: hypothetical protein AUK25_07655 [Desulfobacteraceae bacterium CG2_30_51_40]PIV99261.1 MAG: hypothetical protein COW41_08420 [Deltaproteobacteria bacterium CG17_big_fil_post_rev_8_21_14_2_50_51_6]PIX18789.1 MAG: hypothetical protein COZ70_12390 [Deltaproteobacteria bacterium CG_4_8_14_3_um_filter_51_11]PIY26901.1 MAG: hypothetical protein COZ11_01485 [Deltaproteobacteria bacterium CG_4_10_14_3_um_filter_51_14]
MEPLIQKNVTGVSLDEDDVLLISDLFQDVVVEKLKKLHARNGIITCGFAGEKYGNWLLRFRSSGSGFEIVGFEFDERAEEMGLDL